MKKDKMYYWICTVLMAAFMGVGAIPDLISVPSAVELFAHLGYPKYLLPFLGAAKILGVVAILIPGFPRIKEWAYAGLIFDLTGALYSTLAVGDPITGALFFLIGYVAIGGSYIYYHRRLKTASQNQTKQFNQKDLLST